MSRNDFPLIAIDIKLERWEENGKPRKRFLGWSIVGRDMAIVLKPGQMVKLDGTAGVNPAYVVKHDPGRRLVYVKHDGYSSWLNRGSGLGYSPACFRVYEYDLRVAGNEQHPYVSLFGIAELPLSWKPEWADHD